MFDRETIIHAAATLFVLCTISFIVALSLRIWQKRPRKAQELVYVLDVTRLVQANQEAEALYRQEVALGNEVVRLRREIEALEQFECRPVREAWEIIERAWAK